MDHPESTDLDRLIALANEAEQILARSVGSHDIRHACAVARGYLDLARSYNEQVNVEDVERVLSRMRALLISTQPNPSDQYPRVHDDFRPPGPTPRTPAKKSNSSP